MGYAAKLGGSSNKVEFIQSSTRNYMNGAVYISFPVDIIGSRSIYEPNTGLAVAGYFYSGSFYVAGYGLSVSSASTRGYTVGRGSTAGYISTTYMYMK